MVLQRSPSAPIPFEGALEPAAYFVGQPQEEAVARLEWLVANRQRCGLVVGDEGMGKSHLAAVAARRFAGLGAEVAVLSLGGLPEGEWLDLLLERLPLDPHSRAEPLRPWQKLEDRLRENTLMERTTALILDDLDRGPADAREGATRLVAALEPRFARVVVVATCTPEGLARVPDPLRQRTAVRIELEPWTTAEVAAFVAHGLHRAGLAADAFSPAGLDTLARFSGGRPRIACRLARLAVVAAEADGLDAIDAATIERIWRELTPDSGPSATAPGNETSAMPAPHVPRVRVVRRLGD